MSIELGSFLKGRWYHAARDLTSRLLTVCSFPSDTETRLTPFSLQLWLVCFVLLKQIQQFDLLERELAAFDRLDNPNIYFEHALNLHPRRKGSNNPLLGATTSHEVAAIFESMISNLESDYTEDESASYPNKAYKISSLDYPSAIETVDQMIDKLKPLGDHRFLYGTLGRIYLGIGDLTYSTMLHITSGHFNEAKRLFREVLELDPSNVAAANNQASLRILEALTTPAQYQQQQQQKLAEGGTASRLPFEGPALHEAIVSNPSNLLDAESDHPTTRKMSLLERVAVRGCTWNAFQTLCIRSWACSFDNSFLITLSRFPDYSGWVCTFT
ncbi:tetratricopeptide repeat protein 15 [Echinococcus multilocularis]|uniref:Tetratricopeptide repeat protein 15 n=1 Tax=Echinococcus multilocularis TaxID=6211 RepID=A0A068YJZ6_ECHMU|nr:tetratricopeptide repeat protein 15 [Echinococcus multilocularis]